MHGLIFAQGITRAKEIYALNTLFESDLSPFEKVTFHF